MTGASSQQEQLYILLRAVSGPQRYLYRYVLGVTKPAATMQLPSNQSELEVSAGDQYVITSDGTTVNVYGANGTHTAFTPPRNPNLFAPGLVMSTDKNVLGLISFANNSNYDQVVEYRAPFTTSFSSTNILDPGLSPGGGLQFLNRDGSEALGILESDFNSSALIGNIPSGNATQVDTGPQNVGPCNIVATAQRNLEAYDGTHDWLYSYAGESCETGGTDINRVVIFDIAHAKYLGYINIIPGLTGGITVNQTTGDLYVVRNRKVYVYNVPTCHCTTPRRVLSTSPPVPAGTYWNAIVDPENKHLLLSAAGGFATEVIDVNPLTGTVQGTYRPSTSSNLAIGSVVAQ